MVRPGLAVVDAPGLRGVLRAHQALAGGRDVVLLPEAGVDVAHEVALKERAARRGLLVMGPGAGAVHLAGVGLGVGNVLREGPIAVVGAGASAVREVGVLVDRLGGGVRALIGVGPRDLTGPVGGAGLRAAAARLRDDPGVRVVVGVLFPCDAGVVRFALAALAGVGRPLVVCGVPAAAADLPEGARVATTLESAAIAAVRLAGGDPPSPAAARPRWVTGGTVRGLFTGGGLCAEAAGILAGRLGEVAMGPPDGTPGHRCTDLGDPRLRGAVPHPVADPTVRTEALRDLRRDARVRVLLLDVVLGHGAHPDPAGALAGPLAELLRERPQLTVIAHVVGTERDPQGLAAQERALAALGVRVAPSNASAARLAAAMVAP